MFTVETPAAVPSEPIWCLSVAQYHAMIQSGILTDGDPVELLEGWLVVKMPKNPRHRAAIRIIRGALENLLPDGWYVDTQEPITTTDSEPEPDVVIVRGNTCQYLDRHPGLDDIALVIEVSDATLQSDLTSKYRTYARANISIYWIVNLVESQIEVYTDPSGPIEQPNYSQRRDYALSDSIPVMLEEVAIGQLPLQELFP
ncbi:MAG: Uma2 family endonuclease [Leptolyngbya sp. SIO3F4]|nr:Uma2 family endonuclease [Leptolyngbya sp. SIO3F4]